MTIPIEMLITGGFVITMDTKKQTFYPGSVAIDKGRIVNVGLSEEVDSLYNAKQYINADDHVILPGLINIHGHASNSLIRGLGQDLTLENWLTRVCWPCMGYATGADIFNGALLSATEMLLNGITTFADMWINVGQTAKAVGQTGQRAMLAHNIKDFGDSKRGYQELAIAVDTIKEWNGYADGRVMIGLGPHSVYTCTTELLAKIGQIAKEGNIHIQIHACETLHEVHECQARNNCSPIEILAKADILGPNTIIAHAVHLTQEDMQLIKSSGASIAHNICSNLKLASGIAPIHNYIKAGIPVGIGTDGAGSNDSLDLLRDLKTAILIQKAITSDATTLTNETALELVTIQGAHALGLSDVIGSLEPGKAGDVILLNFDQPRLIPRHYELPNSIFSQLVFSASGVDIDTVIIAGKVLVKEGQLLHLDLSEIKDKAQASSQRIIKAANII